MGILRRRVILYYILWYLSTPNNKILCRFSKIGTIYSKYSVFLVSFTNTAQSTPRISTRPTEPLTMSAKDSISSLSNPWSPPYRTAPESTKFWR